MLFNPIEHIVLSRIDKALVARDTMRLAAAPITAPPAGNGIVARLAAGLRHALNLR
jgi:hypothetical protein